MFSIISICFNRKRNHINPCGQLSRRGWLLGIQRKKTMQPQNYEDAINSAKVNILATCCKFAHRYQDVFPPERFNEMVKAMQSTDSLMMFSCHVRQTIVENFKSDSAFDSGPFWAIIDAINFFFDGTTVRWQYMDVSDKIRHLKWSVEKGAESLLLQVAT